MRTGASSHQAGDGLTVPAGACELHQVVQWLRSAGYSQVNSIGHSLGSVIAVDEAAIFRGRGPAGDRL